MRIKSTTKLPFRRRREQKTDYKKRYKLVKSNRTRIVIRKTNKYLIVHVVKYKKGGDETKLYLTSKELKKYGWKYSFNNLPAAYLTGLLLAKKVKEKGLSEEKYILDLGRQKKHYGSKIFSLVKGLVDGGLAVDVSEVVFPKEERIKGEHIAKYAEKLKNENQELYKKRFSKYLKEGALPEKMPEEFEKVKEMMGR